MSEGDPDRLAPRATGRSRDASVPPRTDATPGLTCDLCGGPVRERHCKIVCLNCGFQRDCSDP
ncbi:MAG: hypothetical protein RQ745_09765 [Longimicrobiales bacterium]|nr:hypothetical protein [Longimicrobiales bacterium]